MSHKPWYKEPAKLTGTAHIAIVGGGIAGVCTYLHLKKAGFSVTIIDKNTSLMMEASGNPVAILDPFLSAYESVEQKYYLQAYKYALKFYKTLPEDVFVQCELVKLAKNWQEKDKFKKLAAHYNADMLHLDGEALILPSSGYINPSIVRNLVEQYFIGGEVITEIVNQEDARWSLINQEREAIFEADAVILANSFDLANFQQTKRLNLDQVGGQLTYVAPQYDERRIICSEGYVSPPVKTEFGKAHICGATFERQANPILSAKAHHENIDGSPYKFNNPKIIGGRRAVRAMSPDHLPLCGPAPDFGYYQSEYSDLHHGSKHKDFPNAEYHKNLFINAGLGSRGFVHAPILGQYLTALITGSNEPLAPEIADALHPARFIIRELSKK